MIRRAVEHLRMMREHRWTHAHLSEYVDLQLDERERRRVEEHVSICPQCRRVLTTMRNMLGGLRAMRGDAPETRDQEPVAESVIERLRREG